MTRPAFPHGVTCKLLILRCFLFIYLLILSIKMIFVVVFFCYCITTNVRYYCLIIYLSSYRIRLCPVRNRYQWTGHTVQILLIRGAPIQAAASTMSVCMVWNSPECRPSGWRVPDALRVVLFKTSCPFLQAVFGQGSSLSSVFCSDVGDPPDVQSPIIRGGMRTR